MSIQTSTRTKQGELLAGWMRLYLGFLALSTAFVGVWALFAPLSFFTFFPTPGHPWVALLPPYNEHLTRDIGELNLGFAFLFIWTLRAPSRRLLLATLWAWLLSSIPHFIYHLTHLMHFPVVDQIAQTIALGLAAFLPVVLLVHLYRLPLTDLQALEGSRGEENV